MNDIVELYKKYKNKTPNYLSTLTGDLKLLKQDSDFKGNGLYLKIDKSKKELNMSNSQKYRYINKCLKINQSKESIETLRMITKFCFEPLIELDFFNHKEKELNFVIDDIIDSLLTIDDESYELKTKTSGKSYNNKDLKVQKMININENNVNILIKIYFNIVNEYYPIAFHCDNETIVFFTENKNVKKKYTVKEFKKNDLESIKKHIRDYIGEATFNRCYGKDFKKFYSSDYNYSMFERSHLDLLMAYKI